MRTHWKVATFSLVLLLGACGKREERTAALPDDLRRDLTTVTATGGELATAPRSFRRMRFVSDIEQSRTGVPAKRPKISHHPVRQTASSQPAAHATTDVAPDPVVSTVSESPAPESPAPISTAVAQVPEAPTVIAQQPSPEPASAPAGSTSEGVGDRGHGGGLGGLLGGIIGAVVIRGGHGGVDKCDPRTEGRGRPTVIDRPDYGMPLPTGHPTFPGSRYR
jgi:hypothetical protein